MRGEDYSDFGTAVTGKVAARYDFTDAFALRGAVSTGFRAPGLQQEFFTSTATNFINGVPVRSRHVPGHLATSRSRSARSRSTPRSRVNYSLGTVFRFGGFEATIDAYRIDIDDRIVLSENLNTPQVAALIAPFGATVARFFINGVETKTEGIDLVTRYLWRTESAGKFEFVAAGNWNDTEVEKVPSTNVIDNICVGQPAPCTPPVLFARINTLTFEEGTPDSKISLGSTGHAARRHELRRESQGHALWRGGRTRRADDGGNQRRCRRMHATCTSRRLGGRPHAQRQTHGRQTCPRRSAPTICSISIRTGCRTTACCPLPRAAR